MEISAAKVVYLKKNSVRRGGSALKEMAQLKLLLCKKKIVPLCTFLKFRTHLEVNSARLFQNVFIKCSRVLNLAFLKKWIFS